MSEKEEYDWKRAPGLGPNGLDSIPKGKMRPLMVDGEPLVLIRVEDELYAVNNKCPHNGAKMHAGMLQGYSLACPLHRFEFDIRTGRNISGEGYYLEHYPVEVRENGIFVGFPKKRGLFGGWW